MSDPNQDDVPIDKVGCEFVIFRGAFTGHVIACGTCRWCRDPANAHLFRAAPTPREESTE
jgi:hypothetical protein